MSDTMQALAGKPSFTVDWFSEHIPTWERLVLPRLKGIEHPRYLEIGVHEGRSICWMLDNVPNIKADAIDPLDLDSQESAYRENVQNRAFLYRDKSRNVLHTMQDLRYDVIYIDGSHWSKDVIFDTVMCWPILTKGGVMIWDDYGWLVEDDPIKGPKHAIDAFLTCYRTEYKVLHIGYQFIVEKI